MQRFICLLCGRDKFTRRSPHYCIGGYRKHHIKWQEIVTEKEMDDARSQSLSGHLMGPGYQKNPLYEMDARSAMKALRYNDGKPDWTLLDYPSMLPMVRVMEQGMKKYARENWKLPSDNKLEPLQSAMRHLIALIGGEEFDQESGERHSGHIMSNMMFWNFRNPL